MHISAMTHQISKASLKGDRPRPSWLSKSHISFAFWGALTFSHTVEVKHWPYLMT